jgi:hypothetical protein
VTSASVANASNDVTGWSGVVVLVVVVTTSVVEVVGTVASPAAGTSSVVPDASALVQAPLSTRRARRSGRIVGQVKPVPGQPGAQRPLIDRLRAMFGPLNGVRVALVGLAVVAAIAALIAGYPLVTGVLLLGVAVHGLGWLYLYRQHLGRTTH